MPNNNPPDTEDNIDLPPFDDTVGDVQDPSMDDDIMDGGVSADNPELQKLVDLLNDNPDKIDGVTNYVKGILPDASIDNISAEEEPIAESNGFSLEEFNNIIDEILGDKESSKMDKPIIGSSIFRPNI